MQWTSLINHLVGKYYDEHKTSNPAIAFEQTLHEVLRAINYSPATVEMIRFVKGLLGNAPIYIISDANTVFIDLILQSHKLDHCFEQVITNPAEFDVAGKLSIIQRQEFLNKQHSLSGHGCKQCPVNLCKGFELDILVGTPQSRKVSRVIYAGDGENDLCPILRLHSHDFALIRSGHSLDACLRDKPEIRQQIRAKIIPWATGNDLLAIMIDLSLQGVLHGILNEEDIINPDLEDEPELKQQRLAWRQYDPEELEIISQFWNHRAKKYDKEVVEDWRYTAPIVCSHLFLHFFQDFLKSGKNLRVLDAGCGTGLVGEALHKLLVQELYPCSSSLNLEALDISSTMLDVCKDRQVHSAYHCRALGANQMSDLESYDGILCVGTFQIGGPSPRETLSDFLRKTNPGGLICFTIQLDFLQSEENILLFDQLIKDLQAGRVEGKSCVLLHQSVPYQYLPAVEPCAFYRIWIFRVLNVK
jgi:pyridoxal phosphate phosphatase PHOSPHO2